MKMKNFIFLVVLLFFGVILSGCEKQQVIAEEEILKPVKAIHVKTEKYVNNEEISGNIKPAKVIRSAFKVPGVIEFTNVAEGDMVTKGDTLMSLQSHDYELNVNAAQAQYDALNLKSKSSISSAINQAKANVDFIRTQCERVERLYEKGAVAKKTLEELQRALVVAENKYQEALDAPSISEAQLKQAKAALKLAKSKLEDTVLKSPINGTIVKKLVESGETIAPGYPVVVLGRLDELEVEIGVPDSMLKHMSIGQEVKVLIYGLNKEVTGVIDSIDPSADLETRTFGVKILINNEDLKIKPGMIAKVDIITKQLNTKLVPIDSLIKQPDGSAYVFVCNEDGIIEERKVIVGDVLGERIQILKGLKDGDLLVVEGQYKLRKGDKVKLEVVEQ